MKHERDFYDLMLQLFFSFSPFLYLPNYSRHGEKKRIKATLAIQSVQ